MTRYSYRVSRFEYALWRLRGWSPRYWADGWHWLSPSEYLRLVWLRLTERRGPLPVRPKNDRLIVPIAENRFVGIGCVKYSAEDLTPEQLAHADEEQRQFDENIARAKAEGRLK